MKKTLLLTSLSLFAFNGFTEEADVSLLKSTMQPGVTIDSVKATPAKGISEVRIGSDILYLSQDGKYLFTGDMYDLSTQTNLTQKANAVINKAIIANIDDKDKIIYKAKDEKYKVMVFTDITCPYCTKLHNHMADFNKAGITIEYLAFPRAGATAESGKTMQRIWCAENKTEAMNKAKTEHSYPEKTCDGKQVEKQFALARQLGVNATPTLVFTDGEVNPGYMNAKQLTAILKEKFPKK